MKALPPCGRIFKFCKFLRKRKEIEPFDIISEKVHQKGSFDVISENSSPKGFFWPNKKKKIVISLLSADSRYFRTYALNVSYRFVYVNHLRIRDRVLKTKYIYLWLNYYPITHGYFFFSQPVGGLHMTSLKFKLQIKTILGFRVTSEKKKTKIKNFKFLPL